MRLLAVLATVLVAAVPAAAQYEATLAADINPDETFLSSSSSPDTFVVYDSRLFFSANDGVHGEELWAYDATSGEASRITDFGSSPLGPPINSLTVYDDRLFFSAGDSEHGIELWVYDADTDEASLVADIYPGSESAFSPPYFPLTVYNERLYFRADDGEHGEELWAYDAATDEVFLAADISQVSDRGSSPVYLTVYDGRLFFRATDFESGQEVWIYDAATEEATLAADIHPGPGGSLPSFLTVYDDRLFFSAYYEDGSSSELWVYDAATEEAALIADINPALTYGPGDLTVYDERLYFRAADATSGQELWTYEAATDSVWLAADMLPGGTSFPRSLSVFDERLFFYANDGVRGLEVWIYDAETGEASLAADIYTGSESAIPLLYSPLVAYAGNLFFQATDGEHGEELWMLTPTPVSVESGLPVQPVRLAPPYPNPTSGSMTMGLTVSSTQSVRLSLFDVLGREVARPADGALSPGEHEFALDGSNLPSGVYLLRLEAGGTVATERVTVLR